MATAPREFVGAANLGIANVGRDARSVSPGLGPYLLTAQGSHCPTWPISLGDAAPDREDTRLPLVDAPQFEIENSSWLPGAR